MSSSAAKPVVASGEIRGLTSLRGIAAFYVVLLHFSATAQTVARSNIPSLAPSGVLAVDLFFVLSGFIMAYTYLDDFEARKPGVFKDFLARRFARIFPLNVFVLLTLSAIVLISVPLFGHSPFPEVHLHRLGIDLPLNLLLLQGVGFGHNLNGPSWSISDEFLAYLIFPLLLGLVFHRRLLVCALSIVAAIAYLLVMASQQPHLGMDPTAHGIYIDIGRCFSEFMLGLASYRFYRAARFQAWLTTDRALFGLIIAIGVIVLGHVGDFFAVMLFPFLILAIAHNHGGGQRLFENRILYFMGTISYSLYLIHDPIRPLAKSLLLALHPAPLGTPAAMAFAALGALGVIIPASMTYRFVEKPGRTIFRRLFRSGNRIRQGAPGEVQIVAKSS